MTAAMASAVQRGDFNDFSQILTEKAKFSLSNTSAVNTQMSFSANQSNRKQKESTNRNVAFTKHFGSDFKGMQSAKQLERMSHPGSLCLILLAA